MSANEIIRTKVLPKGPAIKDFMSFTLFAKIVRISDFAIQVVKARTNSRLWIDTAKYQNENGDSIQEDFKEGDEVELTVSFNTCINNYNEHVVKIHLKDIDKADTVETYPFEFKEQEFTFDGKLIECTKTDKPNVYILKLVRLDESDNEMETYTMRYYNSESQPKLGTYEVVFTVKNTPNILNVNGEVFTHEQQYEKEVDGKMETRTSKVFMPCLEIRGLYQQPR